MCEMSNSVNNDMWLNSVFMKVNLIWKHQTVYIHSMATPWCHELQCIVGMKRLRRVEWALPRKVVGCSLLSSYGIYCEYSCCHHPTGTNTDVKQLTGIFDILKGNVHTILLKKLNFSCIWAKKEMKAEHIRICEYWRDCLAEDKTRFNDVIAIDELWMYCYDSATKQSTSQSSIINCTRVDTTYVL